MRYLPRPGRETWEWEHDDLTYKAECMDGSSYVHVYTEGADDWKFLFSRPLNGQTAKDMAQGIHDEVISE